MSLRIATIEAVIRRFGTPFPDSFVASNLASIAHATAASLLAVAPLCTSTLIVSRNNVDVRIGKDTGETVLRRRSPKPSWLQARTVENKIFLKFSA